MEMKEERLKEFYSFHRDYIKAESIYTYLPSYSNLAIGCFYGKQFKEHKAELENVMNAIKALTINIYDILEKEGLTYQKRKKLLDAKQFLECNREKLSKLEVADKESLNIWINGLHERVKKHNENVFSYLPENLYSEMLRVHEYIKGAWT